MEMSVSQRKNVYGNHQEDKQMIHSQYYVEQAKLERLQERKTEKAIFIMEFLTGTKTRF